MERSRVQARVKVYQVVDNKWADKGTGFATLDFHDEKETICIIATSEADGSNILSAKLWDQGTYKQEKNTLIVWKDPESNEDLALSFSDADSCTKFWESMVKIQESIRETLEEYSDVTPVTLPPAKLENMKELHSLLKNVKPNDVTSIAVALLRDAEYIKKLFDLAEGLTDADMRMKYLFFEIFKLIILLNEPNLLELLFMERYILRLVGVFENNPEVPLSRRVNHRKFIEENSTWKEVIPIKDKNVIAKIHQTHRIKYLKDTMLLSVLDDSTSNTINTLIFYNNFEIVSSLQSDAAFLQALFTAINTEKDESKLTDLIIFLQQFCELSKNLNEEGRVTFYNSLNDNGLASIYQTVFRHTTNTVLLQNAIEVFGQSLGHTPEEIRSYILSTEAEEYPLLRILAMNIITSDKPELIDQYCELLRRLVDVDTMDTQWSKKDLYLSAVYKVLFPKFIDPLLDCDITHHKCTLKSFLLDFLSFCATRHTFRIRSFLLSHGILETNFAKLNEFPGYLILAFIRLLRQVLADKDKKMTSFIIAKNLFQPIMTVFKENKNRYNMINSALNDLFDFIDKEYINNHKFIAHLVEAHREEFESVTYVATYKNLVKKYLQHKEYLEKGEPETATRTTGKRTREQFDGEEENYFDISDYDSDLATPPVTDFDDEPNLPPIKVAAKEQDEDLPPKRKKQKLQIKSISFHKGAENTKANKTDAPETKA